MKTIFNTRNKAIIGIAAILISFIIGVITGFSYDSNGVMSVVIAIGVLSLVNILISKIYKTEVSYCLYMAGNCAGFVVSLFIMSKSESIGGLYTVLFLFLIFLAMWAYEMYLINVDGMFKRVVGAFIANMLVTVSVAASVLLVVTVSVIMTMTRG
ncbi:MAG: hypothetical protein HFH14_03195 [Lachnospiraceae bacterium]|nr:hypothetical protein [Lachnospiraceae bacterium]